MLTGYSFLGLVVDSTTPRSVKIAAIAPSFGQQEPTDASHYRLSTGGFEEFGTFSCPVASSTGVNAYVLAPFEVFGFAIQVGAQGDQRRLLLRADNSFQHYLLDGSLPFVSENEASVDGTTNTLSITNNLVVPGQTYGKQRGIRSERGSVLLVHVLLGGGVRPQSPGNSTPYMTVELSENNVLPSKDPYCGQYPASLSTMTRDAGGETVPGGCVPVILESAPNFSTEFTTKDGSTVMVGVVDWVLVEVRATTETEIAANFTRETIMVQIPALLLSNGLVVDGEMYLALVSSARATLASAAINNRPTYALVELPSWAFPNDKSARLVIRHRNHLDVMSMGAVPEAADGVRVVDFTSVGSAYTPSASMPVVWNYDSGQSGDLAAILEPYPNHAFMVPGDTDGNGLILASDVTYSTGVIGVFISGNSSGYLNADTSLNSEVEPNDVTERGYTAALISGIVMSRVPDSF